MAFKLHTATAIVAFVLTAGSISVTQAADDSKPPLNLARDPLVIAHYLGHAEEHAAG